ncbi:MAG TPA: hypothetical protein DCQ93_06200 [Bacteroidetes bacterium]|nr:hypothetical protein [Bacteroidota bacterium]
MNIISLTTDLGSKDFYVAVLKGEILKAIPEATIIDITHEITPFNVQQASFVLQCSYSHFPDGTIHIVGVDTSVNRSLKHLVFKHKDHFFIGPDNGIFPLSFSDSFPEYFALKEPSTGTLPASDIYVNAAREIISGKILSQIGEPLSQPHTLLPFRPILNPDFIKGYVAHIDRFENVILNIRKDEFENVRKDRRFVVHFKTNDDIERLAENYFSVSEGNISVLVNSAGFLEMFMYHGNMAGLLGLKVGDSVTINFK